MPTTDDFKTELRRQLKRAGLRPLTHVDINAGTLHRRVGGYPGGNHRMPACCSAMRGEMIAGDKIVAEPPRGAGATLTIRYRLPR